VLRILAAAILLGLAGLATAGIALGAGTDFPNELKTIQSLKFEGGTHVPRKEVLAALKTREPGIWPWSRKPLLRLDFVRADTAAIEQTYRQHGFLDAKATARGTPGKTDDRVVVTFVIQEGVRCKIANVTLEGLGPVPEGPVRRHLYARTGRAFNPLYLIADTTHIAYDCREHGFLPDVGALATRRADSVDVRYVVQIGRSYAFGPANLSSPGDLHVKPRLILRELVFRTGDPYKGSLVQESIEQIYRTGLFSQVQMTPLPDSSNGVIEFDLRVRERRPRWLDAGIGSGTSERLNFTAEWGHRNINARGLQAVLGSKAAFDAKAKFILGHVEGTLYDPWVLGARRRGSTTVYYEHRNDRAVPSYVIHQQSRGINFQVRREYRGLTRLTVTQDNTYVDQQIEFIAHVDSTTLDSLNRYVPPSYTTHRLGMEIDRDGRDDPIQPFHGSNNTFAADLAGGPLSGTSSFTRVQAGTAWYFTLRRLSVLGLHGRAGVIDPFGRPQNLNPALDAKVAQVPLEDRFRIGGVNTLRGYNENALPASGGLALLQMNVELRVPLIGPFGTEWFVDAGNVWERPSYIHAKDFAIRFTSEPYERGSVRWIAGAGLRLNLPIGPLRFDVSWATQPDPIGGRGRGPRTQFAIGPSF